MVKMYGQILINIMDINWLRILYIVDGVIRDYRLLTVTYGAACAPYLPLRIILQAILDLGPRCPRLVWFLKNYRYIDDIFLGAFSISELMELIRELIAFMHEIGTELDKWAANSEEILEGIRYA